MDNGLYRAEYHGPAFTALGIIIFRDGKFTGVSQGRAEFNGTCTALPDGQHFLITGENKSLPGTPLIFGGVAPETGLVLPFQGIALKANPTAWFTVECAGHHIGITLTRVCDLPTGSRPDVDHPHCDCDCSQ